MKFPAPACTWLQDYLHNALWHRFFQLTLGDDVTGILVAGFCVTDCLQWTRISSRSIIAINPLYFQTAKGAAYRSPVFTSRILRSKRFGRPKPPLFIVGGLTLMVRARTYNPVAWPSLAGSVRPPLNFPNCTLQTTRVHICGTRTTHIRNICTIYVHVGRLRKKQMSTLLLHFDIT